ncbi:DNA-(apurinic or apyrimidinic site) lyase [Elasticomyces elasticus]|nr:DNA-(apurinic or apyrimidinic site) lyase [Elasticomyces elasticus]KAK3663299.1 DNA-(apurinic or apyrimidinic site) lyase [Elasticomyces elasticus]KAK5766424.1 DNA-(apurinic or apyrimidinic site) lyase [Elasticomyces elasticus]
MAKRKIVEEASEDSELSPPPKDLDQAVAGANGHAEKESERPAKKPKTKQTTTKVETVVSDESARPAKKTTRARKVKIEVEEEAQEEQTKEATPKKSRVRKVKEEEEVDENGDIIEKKPKAKRKSKADKERELVEMPLAARTIGHKLLIGAHVSAAGGVQQSILNSVHIGANAFALFLKSQRKWENPPLLDSACTAFHTNCTTHTYDANKHVVPHGSYLVNLAHTDATRTTQAYNSFLDDLKRCERLGITLYNFHPGTDQCSDRPKAIAHLASNINRAHAETRKVVTLLETMTAGGNTIGCSFEDLASIISLVTNKDRVGVCLDTAHVFTAGYDLRTPEAFKSTMDDFEKVVGFKYLRALHLNDSKAPFRSNKDLHANIGTGFLGLRAFHNIVNEPRFAGLPLVLETPIEVRDDDGVLVKDEKGKEKEDKGIWAREIKLLESLMGMDVESEEFLSCEKSLARKGEPERKRLEEQMERVKEKTEKKAQSKRKPKAKKGVKVEEDGGASGDESALSEVDAS